MAMDWVCLTDVCWNGLLASSVFVLKHCMMSAAQTRIPTSRLSNYHCSCCRLSRLCACVPACMCLYIYVCSATLL